MKNIQYLLFSIFLLFSLQLKAQTSVNNLMDKPNFLKQKLSASDSLFKADIQILKQHVTLDSLDHEILKPQLLHTILMESNTADSTITYKTLIDAVTAFKQNLGYSEFRKGIILYKQMAALKVNPNNWETDQTLFKRLGFTEADLEDFLLFISKPINKDLNYRDAYLAYMKEIDSLQ